VRILALDTATENCSAALVIDGRLSSREALLERDHAARILPMVDELLKEAGIALTELSAIAFGRGPGAFTGVRLAASVAQGLAFGAGVPVVPVSNLRALAQRVMDLDPAAARVLVCSDARMREVYWGCFERSPSGIAEALSDERVEKPAAVALPERWHGGAAPHAVGAGFAAYRELSCALAGHLGKVHEGLLPRANEVAVIAVAEVAQGRTLPAEEALPVYLRDDVTHGSPHSH
jgi:tRNA threonylcarbamoyladenosine biosynthesis protein TsaB